MRYVLVTLRRGRKHALLLTASGGLFTDTLEDELGAAIQAQFELGWKEVDFKYYYPGDKHGGDVLLAAVPDALPMPDPTPDMLNDPMFNAIWDVIKTWDINAGGATGNHARAILDRLRAKGVFLQRPS
jgi:hypothetical protein